MSVVADLAEAVKDALNAADPGTFGQSFEAERVYIPANKLDEMGSDLFVKVAPRSDDRALFTRGGGVQRDIAVDVGVQKKLASGTNPELQAANAEADGLATLVEEIAGFLKPGKYVNLPGVGNVPIARTTVDFVIPEHLAAYSIFTSVVTVVFKVM